MTNLSKDTILAIEDVQLEAVEVPEWKGTVYVKGMSGTERDAFEAGCFKDGKQNLENIRARLLVKCLCNAGGERLFDDIDAHQLGKRSAKVLDMLFDVARKVNGLSKADVEALQKN